MTVDEYFESIRSGEEEIAYLNDRIADYRAMAERCTTSLSATGGGSPAARSVLEEMVVKIETEREALNDKLAELSARKLEAAGMIQSLAFPRARRLMELLYIRGFNLTQTAKKLKRSRRYVYDIRAASLEEIRQRYSEKFTIEN